MNHIKSPALLLDRNKCLRNIEQMSLKARQHHLIFRPHFKTHASAEIGNWFRDVGVEQITVSSVKMAVYFADNGWKDITIAIPVNVREISEIDDLAGKIRLNLLAESPESIEFLKRNLTSPVGLFIELDSGYPRTGVKIDDYVQIEKLLDLLKSDKISFCGFLTHSGQTYSAGSNAEVLGIHNQVLGKTRALRNHFSHLYEKFIISAGDTPSCSLAENFMGIDEIRPGNFVFYDIMQENIGSCNWDQIAVALACPVIARYPERGQMVVYGGSVHLSKEMLMDSELGPVFGKVVKITDQGWEAPLPGAYVSSLSQEHGIISAPREILHIFNPGDILGILPVHSCLAAHSMKKYQTREGRIISVINDV